MNVVPADIRDLEAIASLFDCYRQFYELPSDVDLCRQYLGERLRAADSRIFVARSGDRIRGFVQMYPTFCSLAASRIFVLYDLFVEPDSRREGVAEALMETAANYARDAGAVRIDLMTGKSNFAGQHLYEKLGYKKANEAFFSYELTL